MATRRADATLVTVPPRGVIFEGECLVFSACGEERFAILRAVTAGESGGREFV
jgi:hypothetical protein